MDNPVYQFNQESWNAMGVDPEQQIDDQAYMALRLSKKLNEQVEIVAADLDKSAQSGFPVNFFKLLDNAELPDNYSKEMLSKSISPLLKRTIATNPERAGFFTGDQLEKWNAVMREAEEYARHQRYIDTVLDRIQREGSPGDDAFERRQSVNDMRKRRETWAKIQEQAQINRVVNALDAYWPTDFRKENDSVLDARLEILNTMGIDTSMVDRDELRKTKGYQFREAVNLFGVLDAMENGENLGWLIANKMTDGAAVDLLAHVDENSPLFVQEKALELLRKERYDAMPETGMEKAFNSLFKSTAFMTEMALTSGMGEAFGLVKAGGAPMLDQLVKDGFLKFIRDNGLKGFGQAVKEGMKRAGANAVGRLPVYLPSVTLNTFSEVAPSVVTIPDDFGNPSITVKESDVTDFIQRLVTNTVTQSIEMFTEELGPLIPLGDLDAKMVAAFLPKTVRNFVAQSLIRNPATRRIAERAILDRVPFDGLIGEFGEEVIGQFMMFGATLLGYGMGFRPENTAGTMSPIMSKEEAGDTLAAIALQSVLFRGIQVAHAELTNRGAIAMIRDAQRAKSDRTHFEAMRDLISETRLPQSNVNEAERTLGLLLNGDAVVSVTPESLEGILQQATEGKTEAEANEARATLEQLGVTTDAIGNAKKNGTDVLLSRNRLWAVSSNKGFKNAKELVDRILDNEVSEVFGKTTKEITADGFTKEQIDEMVDRSKRQEDFLLDVQKTMSEAIRTAQKNAIAAGNKLGISQQNVQDFVSIYTWMANYLAENVETEEGLAKLKEMVDNLSVQFAEAPEKFDTTALDQIVGRRGLVNMVGEEEADRRIAEAETMKTAGDSSAKIWAKTGLQLGADGQWRAEIPDIAFSTENSEKFATDLFAFMDWYSDVVNNTWSIAELVDAPELFEAYPQLRRLKVEFANLGNDGTRGMYVYGDNRIYLNKSAYNGQRLNGRMTRAASASEVDEELRKEIAVNAADMLSTIAHEMQHAIQEIEGFARGSSIREVKRNAGALLGDPVLERLYKEEDAARKAHGKSAKELEEAYKKSGLPLKSRADHAKLDKVIWNTDAARALLDKLMAKEDTTEAERDLAVILGEHLMNLDRLNTTRDKVSDVWKDWFGTYKRVAGEVEARNVQARMRKKFFDRLGIPLSETEDTPREDQIVLNQVSPVWTGSAASYEQPSVVYIGTGEGNAAFGYGLYGSESRNVGEWYAKQDVRRKRGMGVEDYVHSVSRHALTLPGGRLLDDADVFRNHDRLTEAEKVWFDVILRLDEYLEERLNSGFTGTISAEELRKAAIAQLDRKIELSKNDPVQEIYKSDRDFLLDESNRGELEFHDVKIDIGRNLYKQTFWPDKEENLLDWDEYIEAEQAKQILRQAEKEHLFDVIPKEEKFSYGDSVIDSTVYLRTYLTGAADGETILRGRGLYYTLEKIFESKQKASEFLHRAGIDGITYIGPESGARNYVAFSDKDIRVDEHILFQNGTVTKGQINLAKFAQSQEAIISLFKDADASTLPHESAHWLKAAMESLVGAGFATDKMKQDLDTINAWLDKQDYTGAVTDQDKYRAREEYFARAFEQYLREGRFPEAATTGLKSALRRLARMLQSIYRNALALNAPIDDSIRGFFDDIFAVEEVVDGTSVLSGILREINTGALAFSKEDLKKLETAVAGAREDAETEAWLAALQDYQKGLKEQQKLWRNEAKEAYEASKAEQAYTYVRNGHKLDENFLRNVLKLDEETISILKKKRLTYKAAPVETAPAAEAPVEAPVVAETAAPAVEPAPTETPVSTASAEAKAATPLDGTPEQFDALGEDTTISLPEGEEAAQNAVANLVYGPDGKGGAIWRRIKVNPTGAELGDVLYKLYTVASNRLSEPAPVTKAGLIGYLSRTAFNTEQQAFRDQQKAPESMDETVFEGKDGDGASRYDVTGRTDFGFTSGDSEAYLTALSDFTETLADGTLKREIADIIYELSDAGEQATNEAIMAEYRQRGGTRQKTSLYDAIKEVRRSIRDYMQNNGFLQSLDVETPASILDTMKELDYGDVNDLITDLKTAMGRSAFIKDYMNRKHAEYRNAFLDNPNWASEAGATRYLDAILRALKVTEGMKFSERVKLARAEAMREVANNKTLREVLRTETSVRKSLKSNAAKILKSIKSGKEDKAAAITAALDMCRNDARLDAVKRLRAEADHLVRVAKRAGRGKPGSAVNGDAMNIVRAVLYHFGLSNRRPEWTTGPGDPQNVTEAFRTLAEFAGRTKKGITDPAAMDSYVQMERDKWSSWLWGELTGANARARAAETAERRINDAGFTRELFGDDYYNTLLAETTAEELVRANEARTAFLDLSMVQLRELSDFAAWANGTGRESVLADKKSFAAKLNANLDAILPSLKEHAKGAFKDNADKKALEKLASSARAGIHSNKSILWISHLYDGRTEFFGEHIMGPMRRLFQLPLSAGASKEMFWYDRISAAVKPHEVALMKSAQDRKLTFAVNNEVTKRRGYEQVYGKQCAFILLNAGTVEGRQRLMDGFGWSEAELNANLSKFTKEDFEHAEAIWASLKELGTEVAKTFYKERHYRMPWADLAPIEVTLEDGTRILSDGGYFPIAYKYHDSERGYDTDIMNPFERMPNRQGRPSATFGRESEVHRQALLLDPSVLERHIKETSHYVGMWEPLSMANAIWSNPDFKDSAIQYFGPEAYRVLRDCMNYINNPFQNTGKGRQLANWLGASFATVALGYKITTIEKQYVSLLLGVDRLVNHIKKEGGGDEIQGYFKDAWDLSFTGFPDAPGIRGFRSKVADMSPFLRSRFNNYDRDITVVNSEFKSKAGQATDKFRYVGFLGLKLCDLHVAGVQWYAAYQWALNSKQNFSDTEARAFADDFVASTQGGARTIDMPAIQLSDLGKAVTPFFGPACAAFNTRLAGLAAFKEMTPSERVSFAVDNFLLPVVALGLISAIQGGLLAAAIGGGDDDDWDRIRRRSLIAMLSEPVSGIAVIQDVADAVVRAAVNGRPIQDEVLEVGAFRPFNDIVKNAYGAVRAWDNPDYALYLGVSAAGEAMGVPVVQVYEDYEKMILWNFGDKSSKPIKKQLQGEKHK